MKVILAGLFVFIGITILVGLLGPVMEHGNLFLVVPILVVAFFALILAAGYIFNSDFRKRMPSVDAEKQYDEWMQQGLITTTKFTAIRAFEVEEVEDEGRQFFLELNDGSVLFLAGQYLYDLVEPLSEEGEAPKFPCTEFTIERHKNGFAIDVHCEGILLEYESLEPTFWEAPYWKDDYPEDGLIITDRTFDQLKQLG